MRNIVVDDEVYAHLVRHTQEIGESASSILRRLLGFGKDGRARRSTSQVEGVFEFLKHPELYHHMNSSQRFLFVLSWAYRKQPKEFDKVLSIEGNRRKYFAKDAAKLLESGSSVNPRQIPDSPYWVITNNSTAKKCEMLSDVLRLLGYESEDISGMIISVMNR